MRGISGDEGKMSGFCRPSFVPATIISRSTVSFLSPHALILPLYLTLPPSTTFTPVEGGSVRERGRIKACGERRQDGVVSCLSVVRLTSVLCLPYV